MLVRRISTLLGSEGYTIRGVQALLATEGTRAATCDGEGVEAIRNALVAALHADRD